MPQAFIPRLIDLWRPGELPCDRPIRTYACEALSEAIADLRSGATIKPVLRMEHQQASGGGPPRLLPPGAWLMQ